MGLQREYNIQVEAIRSGQLSHGDPELCGCNGGGWFLTSFDTWEECPFHPSQHHPEDLGPKPVLYVEIENLDGSKYKGVIGATNDGTGSYKDVLNDGPVFSIPDTIENLEEAKRVARDWRKALNGAHPRKNVKVRLHREWL
jgi:hypothetical protein